MVLASSTRSAMVVDARWRRGRRPARFTCCCSARSSARPCISAPSIFTKSSGTCAQQAARVAAARRNARARSSKPSVRISRAQLLGLASGSCVASFLGAPGSRSRSGSMPRGLAAAAAASRAASGRRTRVARQAHEHAAAACAAAQNDIAAPITQRSMFFSRSLRSAAGDELRRQHFLALCRRACAPAGRTSPRSSPIRLAIGCCTRRKRFSISAALMCLTQTWS